MCILGAVFVDHVVVQHLTNFIWIDLHNDDELRSITHILASLGTGIAELETFYGELSLRDSQPDPQRFSPVGEQVIRFLYQAYLMPKTPEGPSQAIFLLNETKSRQQIVVKFVQRHNAKAHSLLASTDRTPQLLYCSMEGPNPPDLAGLVMVVMGYIDGQTTHRRYGNQHFHNPFSIRLRGPLESSMQEISSLLVFVTQI
ncbi:hypothetical protein BJY52DRAFT_696572 [Lactarius psammicola]|nr:hypothetical protein BJY52DRAFT_696572 [Lactarius psammicola]